MKAVWEKERSYCLNCINKPCSKKGCPLENDIPSFIEEEDAHSAFKILSKTTVLPAICGRICPHSKQCQGSCIRGIQGNPVRIGQVEAYIGDMSLKENYKIPLEDINNIVEIGDNKDKITEKKVAVIGSGPCGLTCAAFLAKYGVQVTIFEKYDKLGGLLIHGIPDFRLDRKIVNQTINKILELGIQTETNRELGKNLFINDLINEYDAVFIAIGANLSNQTLYGDNIIKGNEFLEKMNIIQEKYNDNIMEILEKEEMPIEDKEFINFVKNLKGKRIAVSGGGNVAMDCARTLKRFKSDVTIVYRRDEEQMPAEKYEIEEAKKEGINMQVKTNIESFDSFNKKLKCIRTELVQKENESRLSPVNIEGSNFDIDIDYVVLATGSKADTELLQKQELELNDYGYIKVDEHYQTSIKKVYAGGDVAGCIATVAFAARNGRDVAEIIIKELAK